MHNATYTDAKFWDGRRPSLAEQVLDPFTNPREHGLTDHAELLRRFQAANNYTMPFQAAFERPLAQATFADLAKALSAYVRHLKPQHTNLERFILDRNKAGLSEAEQRGLELFRGRARCAECHQLNAHQMLMETEVASLVCTFGMAILLCIYPENTLLYRTLQHSYRSG